MSLKQKFKTLQNLMNEILIFKVSKVGQAKYFKFLSLTHTHILLLPRKHEII